MLKRSIDIEDIVIYDKIIAEDTRNAGYNIGDLLNMPAIGDIWPSNPHANLPALERMKCLGMHYQDSIVSYYCSSREDDEEPVPNINRIINSVEHFKAKNEKVLEDISLIVKEPNVCCVHIRNGDLNTEDEYINTVIKLSFLFDKIIILSGIHLDNVFRHENGKRENFLKTMNNILQNRDNIYIYLNTADIHLSIMSMASNLLIHKGGFSCLGSIVCNGNLFITKYFCHANCNSWKNKVNKKYSLLC